jgi:hypothetical protein
VYGIFALITNIISSTDINLSNLSKLGTDLDILKISLGSKIYLSDNYEIFITVQVWLGCALTIIFIVYFMVMERFED